MIRAQGNGQATQIAYVLAQSQVTVDELARQSFKLAVLGRQLRTALLELFAVFVCPPVAQVTVAVILGA